MFGLGEGHVVRSKLETHAGTWNSTKFSAFYHVRYWTTLGNSIYDMSRWLDLGRSLALCPSEQLASWIAFSL